MPGVIPTKNENFESLVRRFKKQVEKSGIIQEYRHREYYEKPSTIKNRQRNSAKRRKWGLHEYTL